MTENARTYYCSMKFKYLKIDLTSQTTYNCHASAPHKINFQWLKSNPGQLFNTEINVNERIMMLNNQRNSSCEQNCWRAEDIGSVSPRLYQNGTEQTHNNSVTMPEIIDITVNSECNLTCSYCCKEYSNKWRQDMLKHGNYVFSDNALNERYTINNQDRVLESVSQKEMNQSARYQLLLNEIQSYSNTLKKLEITGGEPLLDNQLLSMLTQLNLPDSCRINLYTGLGVDIRRFKRAMSQLACIPNLHVKVSAEGIGKFAEFNRYGILWTEFQEKIDVLSQMVDWSFNCTLSNLTVMGFFDFYTTYVSIPKIITFAYTPTFMGVHILDELTKKQLQDQLLLLPQCDSTAILQSMAPLATENERLALSEFLTRFIKHRNVDLSFFPKTFTNWLKA